MALQIALEQQEVQLVLVALSKLPLENSLDTWMKIRQQAEAQLQAQQAPAPDASGAPEATA